MAVAEEASLARKGAILAKWGFDQYRSGFRRITRASRRHFEGADWREASGDMVERLTLYRSVVLEVVAALAQVAPGRDDRPRLAPEADATFANEPIVCFQREAEGDDQGGASSLRRLLETPPDVFRMLLGLIASGEKRSLDERTRAAEGLARGLVREATLRHWLYDTGYLSRARENLTAFAAAFGGNEIVAPVAQMLLGLADYSEISITKLEPHNTRADREAVRLRLSEAVAVLSRALALFDKAKDAFATDRRAPDDLEVVTLYLADHLVTLLARTAVLDTEPTAAALRDTCLATLAEVPSDKAAGLFTSGWVRSIVEGIDPGDADPVAPLLRMDERLSERIDLEARATPEDRRRFAMRSFQLGGHIGGTYFLRPKHDADSLRDGQRWQERAITRAHRVVRDMDALGPGEHYGTRAHGLMDAARATAALVYFRMVALHEGIGDPTDQRYGAIEAIERFERGRKVARIALLPGERLTTANWHGLQDHVFGNVFREAFFGGGMTAEEAAKALVDEEKKVLEENRRYAQKNPRAGENTTLGYLKSRIPRASPRPAPAEEEAGAHRLSRAYPLRRCRRKPRSLARAPSWSSGGSRSTAPASGASPAPRGAASSAATGTASPAT